MVLVEYYVLMKHYQFYNSLSVKLTRLKSKFNVYTILFYFKSDFNLFFMLLVVIAVVKQLSFTLSVFTLLLQAYPKKSMIIVTSLCFYGNGYAQLLLLFQDHLVWIKKLYLGIMIVLLNQVEDLVFQEVLLALIAINQKSYTGNNNMYCKLLKYMILETTKIVFKPLA